MDELWIATYSVEPWDSAGRWTTYLERAENILGSIVGRLDTHDPPVRKAASLMDSGRYLAEFGAAESSRRLFGKLEKSRVSFAVSHFRSTDRFANALTWYFPGNYFASRENFRRYEELFALGNAFWSSFYAYGDSVARIRTRKKPSGAVDLRSELPGVFWKTFFNPAYVRFFGKEKFQDIPGATWGDDGSVTLTLGETPELVDDRKCEEIIQKLGKQSFVDPKDARGKQVGTFVVPFSQLRAGQG